MSNKKEIIPDLFNKISESFNLHLKIQENNRILFSGRFGIGKTTFLSHYFEEINKEYNVIHLFPVNYSLLENEDIFSYLKYDILVSLFSNDNYPLKTDYYSFLKKWDGFMLQNLGQVIATTMLLIPKVGKQLNQFVKELKQMTSDFNNYKKSNKQVEMNEINSFLSQFHNAEGGIYESNVITLIIQEWLRDIKTQRKKNLLIIDDLDRIDPSHIFRLLNVFSAHFDNRDRDETKNKFGFDQVLFVCDVDNIRSIYGNQFGFQTDFNGYLDKFFSKEIFRFDNRENILSILNSIVQSIEFTDGTMKGDYLVLHPDSKGIKDTIIILLEPLIWNNSINLRSLFKFFNETISITKNPIKIDEVNWFPVENYFLLALNILSQFIGDFNLLKEKFRALPNFLIGKKENPALFIGDLIMLNDSQRASIIKSGLWGSNSEVLKFDLKEEKYSGEYFIYPPQQNKKIYSGYLQALYFNKEKIDPHFRDENKIDIHELLILVLDKIII